MAARSKKDKASSGKRKSSSSAKAKLKDVSAAGGTSSDPLRDGFDQLRAHVGEKFQQLRVEFQQLGVEIEELRAQERR
jgi:hypothetical protein